LARLRPNLVWPKAEIDTLTELKVSLLFANGPSLLRRV
jgi:hypothetical protein